MTKTLTKAEKKAKKEIRKQQKAASKTVKTIVQPKHEEPPAEPVNLCDDCAYEYGECDGKPKFASDQDETLTGADADIVIECPAFVNVAKMPTVEEAAAQGPATAEETGLILVCSGGCGKTTEEMTLGTSSGEFTEAADPESMVPNWTCQECLDKRAGESEEGSTEPDVQIIRTDLPERPDPKRFLAEEDWGTCQCERPLKRTAYNRYQDAIRCTNGRCPTYRVVVRTVSTGVK